MWRGGLGWIYPLTAPFVWRCLSNPSLLRFHTPLVEPDMQISRIRLSDKASCFRPRKVACAWSKPHESQFLVEVLVSVACCSLAWNLMF